MKRPKQYQLFKDKVRNAFGGSTLAGKRKGQRPLSTAKPIHLVLKASNPILLVRHQSLIERALTKFNRRFGIQMYEIGIHGDHVHLCVRIGHRDLYRKWIRALTSVLVAGIPNLKWKLRPYTRIANWGRGFARLLQYIQFNKEEGEFILDCHLKHEAWLRAIYTKYGFT